MPELLPMNASSGRQAILTIRMNSSAYPQNYLCASGFSRIFKTTLAAYSSVVKWSGMRLLPGAMLSQSGGGK